MSSPDSTQSPIQQPQHQQAGNIRYKVVAGYALQQRLGSGSFATVYKGVKVPGATPNTSAENTNDVDTVAIKAITRSSEKLTKKVLENLEMEISILRTYRHPNIVCLHDVQKTERHFYLILEYCSGGDVQRLIRTRKKGRLSEGLTRRLIRDLASGLKFLWGQELIHRDIKPQNLLLTGSLPLDELNDPCKSDALQEERRQANFPTAKFALKIADFGFARHLQTASLAETLCGSPLYMAPEILQHQRYDAKADLWSVGTVLFEMISGRPPFHGENHIDLLRNIQRKAVRLPPDVRVSKECVNLLRLLLNRNPLSRAGFKEFFQAADAFVALGCNGEATPASQANHPHPPTRMDLGTIQEVDAPGTASMLTVDTVADTSQQQQQQKTAVEPTQSHRTQRNHGDTPGFVTPPFGPATTPPETVTTHPLDHQQQKQKQHTQQNYQTQVPNTPAKQYHGFAPLEPSPPYTASNYIQHTAKAPQVPVLKGADAQRKNDSPHNSSGEESSEFVIVEHNARSGSLSPSTSVIRSNSSLQSSPRYYVNSTPAASACATRGDYLVINDAKSAAPRITKGMLSTSPGTGALLCGMGNASTRAQLMIDNISNSPSKLNIQIEAANKTLTTAEDVGRRAVSVAHLGDTRAYQAMRLIINNEEGSSILSSTPMEGVEEDIDEHSSAAVTDCEDASTSTSTEVARPSRRMRSNSTTDRSMSDSKPDTIEEDDEDMPFAVTPQSPPKNVTAIPIRSNSSSIQRRGSHSGVKASSKASLSAVQGHFGEALSCYIKALSMLKSSVSASQRVIKDLGTLASAAVTTDQRTQIKNMGKRAEVTSTWLSGQFTGVLERADAANIEIRKLPASQNVSQRNEALPVVTVEELIYNHALACGRDGAVKQLLGQYDAARSCYRSAGLLAETLLMEPKIGNEDKKVLEGYVDGFAARINELDESMLQQSRLVSGSPGNSLGGSKRSVIGLIGGIVPATTSPNTGYSGAGQAHRSSIGSENKPFLSLA